jgi:hypothetical protein
VYELYKYRSFYLRIISERAFSYRAIFFVSRELILQWLQTQAGNGSVLFHAITARFLNFSVFFNSAYIDVGLLLCSLFHKRKDWLGARVLVCKREREIICFNSNQFFGRRTQRCNTANAKSLHASSIRLPFAQHTFLSSIIVSVLYSRILLGILIGL